MFYVYMLWTFYVRFTYSCMAMLHSSSDSHVLFILLVLFWRWDVSGRIANFSSSVDCNWYFDETKSWKNWLYLSSVWWLTCLGEIYKVLPRNFCTNSFDDFISIDLSICVSISESISLFACMYVCMYLSLSLSLSLCVCLSLCLCLSQSLSLCIYIYIYISLFLFISIHLPILYLYYH